LNKIVHVEREMAAKARKREAARGPNTRRAANFGWRVAT